MNKTSSQLELTYLPDFAHFILNGHVEDYLEILRNTLTSIEEEHDEKMFEQEEKEFLTAIKTGFTQISRSSSLIPDGLIYSRKQAFLKLLPHFTENPNKWLAIVSEIDRLGLLMKQSLDDLHGKTNGNGNIFTRHILETVPGIVFVFDCIHNRDIYVNKTVQEFLGYSPEEMEGMGNEILQNLVHPDDLQSILNYNAEFASAKDGEIRSVRYRIRDSHGNYRWMRSYESPLKRNTEGVITEKIGIAIDVDNEKKVAEKLKESEELYRQAQSITHIGNYIWYYSTGEFYWSDEMFRLYGLKPQSEKLTYERIYSFNNPDDNERIKTEMEKAFNEKKDFNYKYRIRKEGGEEAILHARGELVYDENDQLAKVIGTVEDVTEREQLINQLQEAQESYREAQSMAHLGNFSYNLITGEIKLTEELLKIFDLKAGDEFRINDLRNLIHPEDRERVMANVDRAINTHQSYNHEYRIVLRDGNIRVIHSIGRVKINSKAEAVSLYGIAQDVTEKHNLINTLIENETLYRHSEEMAKMGNWTWDLRTNEIRWTDELYKIYDIEPQSITVSLDLYKSFVHPDDRSQIESRMDQVLNTGSIDYTYKIITKKGEVKFLRTIARMQKDSQGEPKRIIGTERDVTEKETLIRRLKESEELYKQAQSIAHVGNWSFDVRKNEVIWSDELYRIFGQKPGILIDYQRYVDLLHPDDRELVSGHVQRALEKREPYDFYHRVLYDSGEVRVLHSLGEPIADETGFVYKLIGTAQDVTDRHHIEEELRQNQNFIQKIANATPSIIATYNVNTGNYGFISEGLQKLLGYEPARVDKEGIAFFMNIIHPDDAAPIMEKNSKAITEANANAENDESFVVEFEYRMRHVNGHYRWFHTYGTIFDRNAEGKVENVLNISLDITERKEAEKKIREQEHFIENIAEASPTILYLYDVQENKIIYINQEINFVTGYSPEEIIEMGSSFRHDIYHPDDISKLPEKNDGYHDLAQDDESMFQYECRMKAKNGEWRWLLVREVVFTRTANNDPLQVLGAAIDISDRKDIEQALHQKNIELEQSNTSLEEFAYVASHDLQEPLRKISVFGDRLLAVQSELKPDHQVYLKKIIDSSLRMQNLIDDLLVISRISHDKSFQPYSLQTVLNEVIQLLEVKIEKQKAVITSDNLPKANIIPSQFRQLFQNLLSNSMKFVREGVPPEINITWRYLTPREITRLNVQKGKQYIEMVFQDNGIGFENEFQNKIFAIFQRLHGRSEYEGTGIGLAICKKIIENHSGVIYASGEPDKGATFTVVIPE